MPTNNDGAAGLPAIPASAREVLGRVPDPADRHPGIQLDKLSAGGTQEEDQSRALDAVVRARGDEAFFREALERRDRMMAALGAVSFDAETAGPLTLHLSRASAMENAGICLHPVHGFVYLPASGLKGMARAWAETAWRADQADKATADAVIERVFGAGPKGRGGARAGSVVFHDAWPRTWPRLFRDIVNSHHADYYQGRSAPGDWLDPVPVYFLAIGADVTFRFAVSARADAGSDDVAFARDCLHAALCHRGAGAKTNAGYGAFRPAATLPAPAAAAADVRYSTELVLTSPGFFAGARQERDDCDLRPASLRGQLRWWWRTLHAGAFDVVGLRRLEALIWGDTNRAGAVRLTVERKSGVRRKVTPYDKKTESRGLTKPAGRKTVQGLHYASYGMDDGDRRRHYVGVGTTWTVTLTARDTGAEEMPPSVALGQAAAALWLLCRHGGVGAKARKGFGSFADIEVPGIASLDDCIARAAALHGDGRPRQPSETPDLSDAVDRGLVAEWPVEGLTWQEAIDRAGTALQDYARSMAPTHREHLGVPRKPVRDSYKRHAAPYALHLGRTRDGGAVLRFIGFPAARLPKAGPDREENARVLRGLKDALDDAFGGRRGATGSGGDPRPSRARPRFPRPGIVDGVRVTVLADDGETFRVEFPWKDIDDVDKADVSFDT